MTLSPPVNGSFTVGRRNEFQIKKPMYIKKKTNMISKNNVFQKLIINN